MSSKPAGWGGPVSSELDAGTSGGPPGVLEWIHLVRIPENLRNLRRAATPEHRMLVRDDELPVAPRAADREAERSRDLNQILGVHAAPSGRQPG